MMRVVKGAMGRPAKEADKNAVAGTKGEGMGMDPVDFSFLQFTNPGFKTFYSGQKGCRF
jgi:hypothetical protein